MTRPVLIASNPGYWPARGGSETVLRRILEGCRADFDRVVVFAGDRANSDMHNGIEIRPYSRSALLRFAAVNRRVVYFPNMVHNPMTFTNLALMRPLVDRIVVNMIGGYHPATKLRRRAVILKLVEMFADTAVHVDPLSSEYLIDRAINPKIDFRFITQGIDTDELHEVRSRVDALDGQREPYFVYAHNLWSWKRPDYFLNKIVAACPHLQFVVVAGDAAGDMIENVTQIARGLPNATIRLGLDRSEFLDTVARASAAISTSLIEGAQPNIMLELGFLGVPYLSLCPGQNYGHYPHVEMYATTREIVQRISDAGYGIRCAKQEALNRSYAYFSDPRFSWDAVIQEFRALLLSA